MKPFGGNSALAGLPIVSTAKGDFHMVVGYDGPFLPIFSTVLKPSQSEVLAHTEETLRGLNAAIAALEAKRIAYGQSRAIPARVSFGEWARSVGSKS